MALLAAINRLRAKLDAFKRANPTAAEEVRAVEYERKANEQIVRADFGQIKRAYGIDARLANNAVRAVIYE